MSLRNELESEVKTQKQNIETKRAMYACDACVWGRWHGTKHYCMFPNCFRRDKL